MQARVSVSAVGKSGFGTGPSQCSICRCEDAVVPKETLKRSRLVRLEAPTQDLQTQARAGAFRQDAVPEQDAVPRGQLRQAGCVCELKL